MKNKKDIIEKLVWLGVTNFTITKNSINIKEMYHPDIIRLSRYIYKTDNCYMVLSKGSLKIKFNLQ